MSTTLSHLPVRRYVRTVSSGLATNTEWLGLMAANDAALRAAPWHEVADLSATLPVNDPTQSFAGATGYDAWRQSGNAQTGTGRQCAYAGMAVYRVAIPAGCHVAGATVRLAADKFCVGGLTLVGVLSDAPAPLVEWNGDTAGDARLTGLLAETADKVSASANRTDTVTLVLTGSGAACAYLYLLLALTDYSAHRREYWIEGSGCIDAAEIAVTVAEDVADAAADDEIPLETVPCRIEREGAAPLLVRRAYAVYANGAPRAAAGATVASVGSRLCRSLLSGAAAAGAGEAFVAGAGTERPGEDPATLVAGCAAGEGSRLPSAVSASAVAVYLNDPATAGRTIALSVRAAEGAGVVRLLLLETSSPDPATLDWTDGALLAGRADAVLACVDQAATSRDTTATLVIRRDAATRFALLVALPVAVTELGAGGRFALAPINPNANSIR